MAKRAFQVGDIFFIEISEGNFVFGKVLFDVKKQYLSKVDYSSLPDNQLNYFDTYNDCVLVQMYKGIFNSNEFKDSEILIPRAFCSLKGLKYCNWGIVGNAPVNATEVDFPETLIPGDEGIELNKGELVFLTNLTEDKYEKINVSTGKADILTVANACAHLLNRRDLIDEITFLKLI